MVTVARQQDGDELIHALIRHEVDGRPLTDDEVCRTLLLLLIGGLDSTPSLILEALYYLARNPDEAERLRSGAVEWDTAMEEFVRFFSQDNGVGRLVVAPTTLGGVALAPGERVLGLLASANRDESVFPDAGRCVMQRTENRHLTFGAGAHLCIGRYIARMEIDVMIDAVLRRFSSFRPAEGFEPAYWYGMGKFMQSLDLVFDPA
jgi:cytochrome P450